MKQLCFIAIIIGTIQLSRAQSYEVGITTGLNNYIGEIGNDNILAFNKTYFGVIAKWNFNRYFALRASAARTVTADDDSDSDIAARENRGLSFKSELFDAVVGIEITPFNLQISSIVISPYVYGGFGFIYFDRMRYEKTGGNKEGIKFDIDQDITIPVGAGIKTRLNENLRLGVEFAPRFASEDNLDGSFPEYPGSLNLADYKFLDKYSNDVFIFMGITLTYEIGEIISRDSKTRSKSNGKCFCPY